MFYNDIIRPKTHTEHIFGTNFSFEQQIKLTFELFWSLKANSHGTFLSLKIKYWAILLFA